MSDTILVVGATGRIGEPVARRLAAEGYAVRIFARDIQRAGSRFAAPFEIAHGDVKNVSSLEKAMEGCVGVHISLDGRGDWDLERLGTENIAGAARRNCLKRITLTSGSSTCEENAWFPMTRAKLGAEAAVRQSGVPSVIFRCTMFMETAPMFVRQGRALIMGNQPNRWHWVAADDYAAMVARAYGTGLGDGKTLFVYGPEPLTIEQAIRLYVAECAPGAAIGRIPFWMLSLIAALPGRVELRRVGLPMMRYFSKVTEAGSPAEADALLGKPATTLLQWCRGRAARSQGMPS